jgi:hypothetical protein
MTSVRLKDTTDVVRRPAWVGATEPTSDDTVTVGPGTLWIDDSTTPNVLKRRNDADDGWVAVGLVTGTTAVTAAAGNHNHTHDSLTGRTTDNHHAKAHNVGDTAAHPDVLVTSPATGDALVYDATATKWKNVPVSGGVTLSSANPTTAAPSDSASAGTSLSATHGDHRHGMPATWPPTSHAHSAHSGLGADDHTQYQLRSERGSASGYAPLDSGLLVPVANLGTGTPTGSKFLRDDRTWAVPAGTVLTVEEVDGTPSVVGATKLILPNGTVSVSGTEATYTPSGGGGTALTIAEVDGSPTGTPTTLKVSNGTLTDNGDGSFTLVTDPLTNRGDLFIGGAGSSTAKLNPNLVAGTITNTGMTYGQWFHPSADGYITDLWFYRQSLSTTHYGVTLWDHTTNTQVAGSTNSAEWVGYGSVGWVQYTLPTPLAVLASHTYGVTTTFTGTWKAEGTSGSPNSPLLNNGRAYNSGSSTTPTLPNNWETGAYFMAVDVTWRDTLGTVAAGNPARLGVGSNGQYPVADSAATNGMSYQVLSQVLTDGATISWDVKGGLRASITLGGNRTLAAPTNIVAGQLYVLHVVQDGTGSRTLTWNAAFKWPSGTAPTLSIGAGKRDAFMFSSDGTSLYVASQALDVR